MKSAKSRERFEVDKALDARDAEMLRLELVWLARRYGVELVDFRVKPITKDLARTTGRRT
jgi:hypothetical protein